LKRRAKADEPKNENHSNENHPASSYRKKFDGCRICRMAPGPLVLPEKENAMDRNTPEVTATGWLIGGAALGALAMFLADPERGQSRRAVAATKLSDALTDTRDYLGSKTTDLSDRLKETTERFRDTTDDLTDRVKSTASELSGRAKSKASDMADRGGGFGSSFGTSSIGGSSGHSGSSGSSHSGSNWRKDYDAHPITGTSIRLGGESYWEKAASRELWMIGGAILGALGMYLADPDMGTHRRTMASNKLRTLKPGMGSESDSDSTLAGSTDDTGPYATSGGVSGTGTISDNVKTQGSDSTSTRH
jgi:gas vesicle protein